MKKNSLEIRIRKTFGIVISITTFLLIFTIQFWIKGNWKYAISIPLYLIFGLVLIDVLTIKKRYERKLERENEKKELLDRIRKENQKGV